jgi:hypothetical protein
MFLLTLCSVDSPYIFTNNFPDVSGIFLDMDHKIEKKRKERAEETDPRCGTVQI